MILGDFHVHSNYSDGRLTISEIIDLYGRAGFDAIAITDHLCEEKTALGTVAKMLNRTLLRKNFEKYLDEIRFEGERAQEIYGMTVIPGVEMTKNSFSHKNSAHILGLGVSEFIDPDQDIVSTVKEIQSQGGMAIAAHPVPTRKFEAQTLHLWDHREEYQDLFDAWEVASGRSIFTEVKESGLPMIANSDFHHPLHFESWKTRVDSSKEAGSIIEALKKQKVEFEYWSPSACG